MSAKQQETIMLTERTIKHIQKRVNITIADLPARGWAALSVTIFPADGGYAAVILVQKAKG
jgi:hypothetical protein